MNPKLTEEHIHSDHQPHPAHAESHVIEKSLWRRIMDWRGSFFILSLLAHIVIIGVAAFLVVQVVQGRKEKLKFTAPPPAPPSESVHVKPAKKTPVTNPSMTKRITSTALNASIALPPMEMNTASPDIMSSVMNGMGASGLGAGASGAGMASMSLSGLTAFGFKGNGAGLKGAFYDLKQTPDKAPTGFQEVGNIVSQSAKKDDLAQQKIITEFVDSGWDVSVLNKYYKSKESVSTPQIYIPTCKATEAPKAFGVEKEVNPGRWIIHYKGMVKPSKSGKYYFVGIADDLIMVRFNGENVLVAGTGGTIHDNELRTRYKTDNISISHPDASRQPAGYSSLAYGKTFEVKDNQYYPIEVIISEWPGGDFAACLAIAEENPETPYSKAKFGNTLRFPLFQVKKGAPLPEFKPGGLDIESQPIIFQVK